MKNIIVLGIESSCDETAAALYSTEEGLITSQLFSQTELHKKYGGVVPEIASRAQLEKMGFILDEIFQSCEKKINDINVIAVTNGPGLPGSLLVGICFAKSLAYALNKKIIGINHLEAHAFAPMIENKIEFPHICLTASGGHTQISYIKDFGEYEIIGKTIDDSAGEAFDKVAKMLNYPYPGGPIIEKLAQEVNFQDFFHYPRPGARPWTHSIKHHQERTNKINSEPGTSPWTRNVNHGRERTSQINENLESGASPDSNFSDLKNKKTSNLYMSFSGLKTAVLYDLVKREAYDLKTKTFLKKDDHELKQKVASSLLICIADIFSDRISRALKIYPEAKAITFSGGVACNKYIRQRLQLVAQKQNIPFYVPSPKFCTDNGAMIAFVGHYKAQQEKFDDLSLDMYSRI